jgi:hypothetical protein
MALSLYKFTMNLFASLAAGAFREQHRPFFAHCHIFESSAMEYTTGEAINLLDEGIDRYLSITQIYLAFRRRRRILLP